MKLNNTNTFNNDGIPMWWISGGRCDGPYCYSRTRAVLTFILSQFKLTMNSKLMTWAAGRTPIVPIVYKRRV